MTRSTTRNSKKAPQGKRNGLSQTRLGQATTLAWGLLLASCGGKGLEKGFADSWRPSPSETQRVLDALQGRTAIATHPAAVGITGRGLVGRSLGADAATWKYEGPVNVLPSLSGRSVAFSGEGKVTVLDVESGESRFVIDVSGRRLEGMGTDGAHFVFLLVDSDDARPDQLLLVDNQGKPVRSADTLQRVGTPAALDGIGLVPWGQQYVSAFELSTGEPIGRLLIRDAVHSITTGDDGAWVLGAGATHIDQKLVDSPNGASIQLDLPELPGEPRWPRDGSKPRPARARPIDVWAHPTREGGTPHFGGDLYAYAYFDVVTALVPGTKHVRWVSHFKRAVSGGAAGPAGVAVCLEDGSLWHLRWRDGRVRPSGSLNSRLKGCVISPDPSRIDGANRPSVEEQIHAAITGTGPDMLAIQELLLRDLARRKGRLATGVLLTVARDPLTSPGLSDTVSQLLRTRRDGGDLMVAALRQSAPLSTADLAPDDAAAIAGSSEVVRGNSDAPAAISQSRTLRPPPVAALAEALAAMDEKEGASPLANHLAEPAMNGHQSLAILKALQTLGGPEQAEAVRIFFEAYENAGGDDDFIEALYLSAIFLIQYGTFSDIEVVRDARTEHLTHPDLKKRLQEVSLPAAVGDEMRNKATSPAPR